MIVAPLFIQPDRKPLAGLLIKAWYEHPIEIRCLCGMTIYARTYQDPTVYVSRFECGNHQCNKLVCFVHFFDRQSPLAHDIVELEKTLASGR